MAQLITALQAVHIEGESSSIGIPTAPFELITLEEAMQEDALIWKDALQAELQALKETGTFLIIWKPENRKVIHCRWVL
jgi:hypothetical protein